MANTYTLISSYTVTTAQANVEFTSIPSTYTDLIVVGSCRFVRATNGGTMNINFNGSSSNLTEKNLWGTGSAVSAGTDVGLVALVPGANTSANVFSNFQLYVPNYTSSNNKSWSVEFVSENNASAGYDGFVAGLWSSTSVINAIKFLDNGAGNIDVYSTFYLYGVSNA